MLLRRLLTGWFACLLIVSGIRLNAGDSDGPPLVTVCQIIGAPQDYDHKTVFILGRVTKLNSGRWIGEDTCGGTIPVANAAISASPSESSPSESSAASPPRMAIRFDRDSGPRPPEPFELDAAEARRKFGQVAQRTMIHEFRFGSGEYERWGIAFGRVELDKGGGSIVCRGEAMVLPWGAQVR